MLLKKSTVGAGDSMVGMVWALSQNQKPERSNPLGSCLWFSGNNEEGTQLFRRCKTFVEWLSKIK
jgi:fructose-1-phosphate kinase PfkB-like protein